VTVLWVVALLLVSAGLAFLGIRDPAPEAATPTIDNPLLPLRPTDEPPARPAVSDVVAPERGGPAPAAPGMPPCVPEALQIDVVPTKATFPAGETVRGMFFVQTGRATNCAVAMPTSFRIENVATGKVLGSTPAVTEVPNPLASDGKMHTSTFAWEPRECSGSTCTPLPPALYQAVAEWTGGSSYRGWGEFRIGG
jgi:hypothetical protein